jgi:hypothetical protein
LPNPFYKKGEGGWSWFTFNGSLMNTLRLSLPVIFAFILAFRSKETMKTTGGVSHSHPRVCRRVWLGLRRDELWRALPICHRAARALSWIPLVRGFNFHWLNQLSLRERSVYVIAFVGLSAGILYYSWFQNLLHGVASTTL